MKPPRDIFIQAVKPGLLVLRGFRISAPVASHVIRYISVLPVRDYQPVAFRVVAYQKTVYCRFLDTSAIKVTHIAFSQLAVEVRYLAVQVLRILFPLHAVPVISG